MNWRKKGEAENMSKNTRIIILLAVFAITAMLLLSGCVCPLFSIFERSTGLKISAGENIDKSVLVDELIYPGSVALVQVTGDIERIIDLVATYGVSFPMKKGRHWKGCPKVSRNRMWEQ